MRTLIASACLLAAVAFGAVGCGGDDDELTKAEYLKQGNAICKAGNKEIDAAAEKAFSSNQRPSNAEVKKFAEDTLIPSVEGQIDDLRDLTPPSADEDQVNAILDEADTALDETKADPAIVASGQDPFKKANQLAKSYGLTECAG